MKTFSVLISLILLSFSSWAQVPSSLSEDGARYWKAALTLLDMAKTSDDLEGPIKEFEKVVKSDPYYADTYFNLGKLYARFGKEKGPAYIDKAKEYFEKYIKLNPDDRKAAEDEIYVLNSLKEYSIKSLPKNKRAEWFFSQFEGVWAGDGIKIRITNLVPYEDSYPWLGKCTVRSFSDNGINNSFWDSYTEAVTNPTTLSADGNNVFWQGSIYYNSRASSNRYSINEYRVGSFFLDYDTHLIKTYKATISGNHLLIECTISNYVLYFDAQGYGHSGQQRSSVNKYYSLYRSN